MKTIKSAEDTVKHKDCIRRACEQESGKSVTQRERSPPRGGRPNIQEGGAQISRPAAWRSCPNICLHAACGDPQALRQCGHHPPLSTLSLPLPTAQIHCGHDNLPKLLLKVYETSSHTHSTLAHIHKPLSGSKVKEQDYGYFRS